MELGHDRVAARECAARRRRRPLDRGRRRASRRAIRSSTTRSRSTAASTSRGGCPRRASSTTPPSSRTVAATKRRKQQEQRRGGRRAVASKAGLHVGDTVPVGTACGKAQRRVVGIDSCLMNNGTTLFLPLATFQELLGRHDTNVVLGGVLGPGPGRDRPAGQHRWKIASPRPAIRSAPRSAMWSGP